MADQLRLAGCAIVNAAGEVLLIHRSTPKRTQWEIPGGKIDEIKDGRLIRTGATPEPTVIREIREELAVDVEIVRKLGEREFTEDNFTMHYQWYLVRVTSGQPVIGEPDKYDALRYFSKEAMSKIKSELSANSVNFLQAWSAAEFSLDSE